MERYPITTLAELAAAAAAVLTRAQTLASDSGRITLALVGDLGAGKTTFVQTLARRMGVTETVTSPTFVIMRRYATTDETFTSLIHIDAYRLESVDELRVLGFEALGTEKGTMMCIEWPERVGTVPPPALTLTFALDASGTRTLTVS
jgi:tRNA threonylcarbamoyladenosine biosynthesis protein TsaE